MRLRWSWSWCTRLGAVNMSCITLSVALILRIPAELRKKVLLVAQKVPVHFTLNGWFKKRVKSFPEKERSIEIGVTEIGSRRHSRGGETALRMAWQRVKNVLLRHLSSHSV